MKEICVHNECASLCQETARSSDRKTEISLVVVLLDLRLGEEEDKQCLSRTFLPDTNIYGYKPVNRLDKLNL